MSDDELLLESARFRVVRRTRHGGGDVIRKDVILHPGAVAIVPLVDDEHVCLIRNFRMAVERTLVEVPAGTLEVGEDPSLAAVRELEEETGYRAGKIERLATFHMSPGILNERMHVFVAWELTGGPARREAGEEIDNCVVAWSEAMRMIRDGEIEDCKTVAALLCYDRFRGQ